MDTFYEENQENHIKMIKNKMTLDFNSPASHNKKAKLIKTCILESPDLKMLKLASPELERMIIQQNGLVTTTPTPSSALPYFLKQEQPTEEQEQFSRGFVDALNQLHQTNDQQLPNQCLSNSNNQNTNNNSNQNNSHSNCNSKNLNSNQNSINNSSSDSSSDLTIADTNSHTNSNNRRNSYHMLVPSTVATSVSMQTNTSGATTANFSVPQIPSSHVPTTVSAAAAPNTDTEHYVSVSSCQTNGSHVLINQTVNNHSSVLPPYSQAVNNNPVYPMSIKAEPTQPKVNYPSMKEPSSLITQTTLAQPIDMENQERIKLERKRLRNRIAASKCRRRKLERISKLEDKVKALKGENSELSIVVNKFRDQVCSLKQQVMEHVKCGCQLMSTQ